MGNNNLNIEKLHITGLDIIDLAGIFSETGEYTTSKVMVGTSKMLKNEKGLIAGEKIEKNSLIYLKKDHITDIRTVSSIEVAHCKHIETANMGRYINHSCEPNAHVKTNLINDDTGVVALLSVKEIDKGDEITFDYATTESFLSAEASRIRCLCGSEFCRGKIMSFNDLTYAERVRLKNAQFLANHLMNKIS